MIEDFIAAKIRSYLSFTPTKEQTVLISDLSKFLHDTSENGLFLLKGFAGTGKTSIVSALVKSFEELKQKTVLLAPTGRAAKVLGNYAHKNAFTIHKHIYRQKSVDSNKYDLSFNKNKDTLFIVDEVSLLSNDGKGGFGSGYLLDDLVQFVYSASNCRLLLLGDTAQLPPVMQDESPALNEAQLRSYDLSLHQFTLSNVVRQAKDSGILYNATHLRTLLDAFFQPSNIHLKSFDDVIRVNGENFSECIEDSYREVGMEETIIVTRSNKRAGLYAQGIRNRILYREELISTGDMLMVVKNNYAYGKEHNLEFIANGDIAEVMRVRSSREMHGLKFRDLSIRLIDYDVEMEITMIEDILMAETPADVQKMNQQLFESVLMDYADIKNKRTRYRKMKEDPYLTALQTKFAYAITCHKAQGGQWKHVYVDMGALQKDNIDESFVRWLYTAITRTTVKLHLINFSDSFFE